MHVVEVHNAYTGSGMDNRDQGNPVLKAQVVLTLNYQKPILMI
jgi:hypothetical protein